MKTPTTESTSESEVIRSDIEQTRESMDRTLDKIGERMQPRHLLDQFLDFFRSHNGDAVSETASSVLTSVSKSAGRAANGVVGVVRRHPVPTLLIGAGITWAIVETRRRTSGNGHGSEPESHKEWESGELEASGGEPLPHASTSVGEKLSNTAATAGMTLKEKSQKFGKRISEGARAVGRTAQRGYESGRTRFVEASEAYPISVGVGFLAAGVLLGLTLPHSRKEDQWIGHKSDRTKQQAKAKVQAKAQDLIERGKHVASAAAQAAKETAQQEGLTQQSA